MLYALLFILATPAENFWGDAYPEANANVEQQFKIYKRLVDTNSLWSVGRAARISAIKTLVYDELNIVPSDRDLNEKTIARREFRRLLGDSEKIAEFMAVWDAQPWAGSPPEVTLVGRRRVLVIKDTEWVDPGATASDVIEGVLPVNVISNVDTTTEGVYQVEYFATDEAGQVTTVKRQVTVIPEEIIQPEEE